MHTKCDERTDGRTGVKQYAPRSRGHNNEAVYISVTNKS
jgi:hypothetical protein